MSKRTNQNLSEGQGENDLDELIKADVRGHLHNHGSWQNLSESTGISYQTIYNLAYGWTVNPQQRTLTRLMDGMGHGDKLRKAYSCEDPIFTEQALKGAPKGVRERYNARQKKRQQAATATKKKKS